MFRQAPWTLNETAFAQTIALLDDDGCTPLLVVMPTHPLGIRLIGEDRWARSLTPFLDDLRELRGRYRFSVLDYSRIEYFGGDPNAFYDGEHVKVKNSDLIFAHAFRAVPQAFR